MELIERLGHCGINCIHPKVEPCDKSVARKVIRENDSFMLNDKMSKPHKLLIPLGLVQHLYIAALVSPLSTSKSPYSNFAYGIRYVSFWSFPEWEITVLRHSSAKSGTAIRR
jgi:hypothetical protein